MNEYITDQITADVMRQMNDEIDALRALKEFIAELARKGWFKSANDMIVSIIRGDNV